MESAQCDMESVTREILHITNRMLEALRADRMEESDRLLEQRAALLKSISGSHLTDKARALLRKAAGVGLEVNRLAGERREELRQKMMDSERMKDGLSGYNHTRYNLSAGQILDKKR